MKEEEKVIVYSTVEQVRCYEVDKVKFFEWFKNECEEDYEDLEDALRFYINSEIYSEFMVEDEETAEMNFNDYLNEEFKLIVDAKKFNI